MKLLIASDIHGSAYWCSKLMDAYQNEKADRMILLGDILYHDLKEPHLSFEAAESFRLF